MLLTPAQLTTLKNDILADPTLSALPNNADGHFAIAAAYNLQASPDFWVWKTSLSKADITGVTTPEATSFSWTVFIARTQGERDAWREMFNGSSNINPSLANVRAGLQDIFSGASGGAPEQRQHLLNIARRLAKRGEKLFATGSGTTVAPATMSFEGNITIFDVEQARNS